MGHLSLRRPLADLCVLLDGATMPLSHIHAGTAMGQILKRGLARQSRILPTWAHVPAALHRVISSVGKEQSGPQPPAMINRRASCLGVLV